MKLFNVQHFNVYLKCIFAADMRAESERARDRAKLVSKILKAFLPLKKAIESTKPCTRIYFIINGITMDGQKQRYSIDERTIF